MSHLKEIMLIEESDMDTVVFVTTKQEAGINVVYDPATDREIYQVFVQQSFPLREVESWEFPSFRAAKRFAASQFKNWEFLNWNQGINRPCGKGDACGKGACSTKEGGCGTGGCSSCGATKDFDEMVTETGN